MRFISKKYLRNPAKELLYLTMIVTVLGFSLLPFLTARNAAAAGQITVRSLAMSSGIPSKTGSTYTFSWKNVSTTAIKGIKFIACDTAIGTYGRDASSTCASGAAPTGLVLNAAAWSSQTGFADNANAFARDGTGSTYCTPAANVLCASRATAPTSETTNTAHTIVFNTITNPSTANSAFFIGMYFYATTGDSTSLDAGTVAGAVVYQLQVNAVVSEILVFCAGSTTADAATGTTGLPASPYCTNISASSLSIGTLDSTHTNVSPISSTYGGDGKNGLLMLQTNSANGVTVSYDAIQDTDGGGNGHHGSLKVANAQCDAGNDSLDQCFHSIGTTEATMVTGTENFGMTLGLNGAYTGYACTSTAGTCHLIRETDYTPGAANAYPANSGQVTGTTTDKYAWNDAAATTQIAHSALANPAVDYEAMILKFAATPNVSTPTGVYRVIVDFIATPSY